MSIISSSVKMISGRVFSLIISFITGIILARYLGAEDRGLLSIYLVTIGFIVLVLNAGVAESSIYLLNNKEFNKSQVIKNQVFHLSIIAIFFSLFALIFISVIVSDAAKDFYCLVPIVVLMLLNSLFRHYLLADKKIGTYTLSVILENISLLTLVFLTALFKFSFFYIIFSNLLSQVIVFVFLVKKLKDELPRFQFPYLNFFYIKKSYAFGIHLLTTGLGSFGLQRIGFYILSYFSGPTSVGLYTVGATIPNIYENLPQQISSIALTYIASEKNEASRKLIAVGIVKSVFYALILAAIPLFIFADKIVLFLFGSEYSNLGILTIILTISTIFSGLSGLFYNFLAGIGKPKFGTYLTILNLSLTIVVSIYLIYYYGLIGAAWAKLFSSIISTLYIGHVFLSFFKIKLADILLIKKSDLDVLLGAFKKSNL